MARKDIIIHKGYHGSLLVNNSDYTLHGEILFLDEEIYYKGDTFAEVEKAFQDEVEKHIASCEKSGKPIPF